MASDPRLSVRQLRVRAVNVPMPRPLQTSSGTIAIAPLGLIDLFPEISAHLLAVSPTCHWLEYVDWAAPILQEPMRIDGGYATAPDVPGSGIAWDEASVRRYLVQ